jgi:superfamily II DNA or RNA helicase
MKAVISNRIYLSDPGKELAKSIIDKLTYKFKKETGSKKFETVETIKSYKILPKGILVIPQGRQDLIPDGWEVVDKRVQVSAPFPTPKFELRPEQQVVVDEINDTCFINALVGWGKTFTALHLARKFGQKTLVVTHTTALRDQWAEEVESLFGIEAGIIGGGRLDWEDHAITIANVQTLVKHCDKLAKEFGTIILDEAHHCPATTFTQIIDTFHSRFRIALSGTMQRKDGKHILFQDYFGNHVVKPPQSNTLAPTVRLVKTGLVLKPNATWVEKVNDLANNDDYQQFIAGVAQREIAEGHQVLIIADRVEFLRNVKEYIGENCVLVTGETGFDERQQVKEQLLRREKMSIAGSRQIFSEGISINSLSCVILAIPMNNDSLLEQVIGRVQRQYPGKLNPLVIDMQFSGWADKKQNTSRLGFYMRKGWQLGTA